MCKVVVWCKQINKQKTWMAKFATDCNILFTLLKIRGDCDLPSVDAIRKVHLNRCCLISCNGGDPGSRRFPIEYFYLNFCLFEHYLFHSSSRSKYIRLLYHWVSKAADCCFFFFGNSFIKYERKPIAFTISCCCFVLHLGMTRIYHHNK